MVHGIDITIIQTFYEYYSKLSLFCVILNSCPFTDIYY